MEKVVIYGASGFGREVLDVFLAQNAVEPKYEVIGFVDDNPAKDGWLPPGFPVLGGFSWLADGGVRKAKVAVALGSPSTRAKVVRKLRGIGTDFCTIVHPSATLTKYVELGEGSIVTAGCIFTNHIRLGNHVVVNLDCTVGHDCVIDDYCTLAPGVHVSGNVHIETGCEIGTGAAIIQGLTLGPWSVIGAGAVVSKDVAPNTVAVGVPARGIKQGENGWHNA